MTRVARMIGALAVVSALVFGVGLRSESRS